MPDASQPKKEHAKVLSLPPVLEATDPVASTPVLRDIDPMDPQIQAAAKTTKLSPETVLLILQNRFHYAGGSARFMFERTNSEITSLLNRLVASERGVPGAQSPTDFEVNRLQRSFFHKGSIWFLPVSQHAATMLRAVWKDTMRKTLRGLLQDNFNPSVDGFVFEWTVIDHIQDQPEVCIDNVCMADHGSLVLRQYREVHLSDMCHRVARQIMNLRLPGPANGAKMKNVGHTDSLVDVKDPTWLIPTEWNEATWDFALYFPNRTTRDGLDALKSDQERFEKIMSTTQLAKRRRSDKGAAAAAAAAPLGEDDVLESVRRAVAELPDVASPAAATSENVLYLFQTTIRDTHSLKLGPIQTLVERFELITEKISSIRHIAIVPPRIRPRFQFAKPEGAFPKHTQSQRRIPIVFLVGQFAGVDW